MFFQVLVSHGKTILLSKSNIGFICVNWLGLFSNVVCSSNSSFQYCFCVRINGSKISNYLARLFRQRISLCKCHFHSKFVKLASVRAVFQVQLYVCSLIWQKEFETGVQADLESWEVISDCSWTSDLNFFEACGPSCSEIRLALAKIPNYLDLWTIPLRREQNWDSFPS